MNKEQDKKHTTNPNQQQGDHRNLDDLFKDANTKEAGTTPEEEAEAEQQRKEALTERD